MIPSRILVVAYTGLRVRKKLAAWISVSQHELRLFSL